MVYTCTLYAYYSVMYMYVLYTMCIHSACLRTYCSVNIIVDVDIRTYVLLHTRYTSCLPTANTLMDPVEESDGRNSCSKPEEFVVGGKSSLQKTDKETITVKVTVEVEISETKTK